MSPNSQQVFDRSQTRRRRDRAARTYHQSEFIKSRILDDIEDRILATKRRFPLALSLGGFNPETSDRLGQYCDTLIETDLSPARLTAKNHIALAADEEWLPFRDNQFDLVISPLSLHWVNDLPGTLIQINRCLKPDGFFI